VPVGVTGHRTHSSPGVKLDPPDHKNPPPQLLTGPRGRTVANTAASGPSDRAAGLYFVASCTWWLVAGGFCLLPPWLLASGFWLHSPLAGT
jgi:hypothetical protein